MDPASPTPLFEQVAACVRGAIADQSVVRGERLPAARELADSLDINLHTVLRAYQVLRDEQLIELRRGRGAVVTASDPGRGRLASLVDELVREASRLGIGRAELVRLVEEAR